MLQKKLKEDRVCDHDHITSLYRGAAHNSFNLNYKYSYKIPVIMHNLRGYDHLIMSSIEKIKYKRIQNFPNNMQKCISSLGSLVFIDPYKYLNTSLKKPMI